jgi:hypothetical protein
MASGLFASSDGFFEFRRVPLTAADDVAGIEITVAAASNKMDLRRLRAIVLLFSFITSCVFVGCCMGRLLTHASFDSPNGKIVTCKRVNRAFNADEVKFRAG